MVEEEAQDSIQAPWVIATNRLGARQWVTVKGEYHSVGRITETILAWDTTVGITRVT